MDSFWASMACGVRDGMSLVPLIRDPKQSWKKAAFSVAKRGDIIGHSVRTKHWRYTEYTDGSTELYNCRIPVAASRNQVRNDKCKDIVAQHQIFLHKGLKVKQERL